MNASVWPMPPRLPVLTREQRLREVFARGAIDLVLDVGANVGQFARELRTFYSDEVISFEPAAQAFAQLQRAARGQPRWQVLPFALGRTRGEAVLHTCASSDFSSLLRTNDYCGRRFGAEATSAAQETVALHRLDEVLAMTGVNWRNRRIFLKMDTQGFDLEVLEGLGDSLEAVVALQSEVSLIPIYQGMPHWTASIARYEAAGFGVVDLYPVTREGERVIEYDCLMTRIAPRTPA
ncbi:MAG: FkbM family methyltransferase [Luteimonas sp.]